MTFYFEKLRLKVYRLQILQLLHQRFKSKSRMTLWKSKTS